MAILIDPPLWPGHGRLWSHLISDQSYAELHAFAAQLGIPRRGFEGDHYDVPAEYYGRAVVAGAQPVSSRELLFRLQDSGLRRRKRLGEKVVDTYHDGGVRVDVVASRLAPTIVERVHLLVLARDPGDLELIEIPPPHAAGAQDSPLPGLERRLGGGVIQRRGYARWMDGDDRPFATEALSWIDLEPTAAQSGDLGGSSQAYRTEQAPRWAQVLQAWVLRTMNEARGRGPR